jgi:UTP:GlnB (protein PII) uridylyltransferase
MSKYASGISLNDVCKLEVEEAENILKKYNVNDEDKIAITDMIKEAYYQLHTSFASCRATERLLEDITGKPVSENKTMFQKYIIYMGEESHRFPFDCDEGEDDGK